MEDKFVWDDETVCDFFRWLPQRMIEKDDVKHAENLIDVFKRSKQPKEDRDWVVLEFKHNNGLYNLICNGRYDRKIFGASLNHVPQKAEITSVKRLSDNEVFSIGDSICLNWYPEFDIVQPIEKIEIENGKCFLYYRGTSKYELQYARINPKHKNKQPLFTTEDGKEIFEEGIECFLVKVEKDYFIGTYYFNQKYLDLPSWHLFSTKEAAENFVLSNKPCLSLDDLLSAWGDKEFKSHYHDAPLFLKFKQLAKEKINKQ